MVKKEPEPVNCYPRVTCGTAWWRWAPRRSAGRSAVRRWTCTWCRRCRPRNTACRPVWPPRSCYACCSSPAPSSTCSSSGRISPRSTGSWSSQSLPKRTDNCLRETTARRHIILLRLYIRRHEEVELCSGSTGRTRNIQGV